MRTTAVISFQRIKDFSDTIEDMHLIENLRATVKKNKALYSEETELNGKFRTFMQNCSLVYGGKNTVGKQLGIKKNKVKDKGKKQ